MHKTNDSNDEKKQTKFQGFIQQFALAMILDFGCLFESSIPRPLHLIFPKLTDVSTATNKKTSIILITILRKRLERTEEKSEGVHSTSRDLLSH